MNRSRFSLYFVLALSGLVSTGASAKSRQTNIFCYHPTDNFVGRGQTFNGKLCKAEWGALARFGFVRFVRLCRRHLCRVH
jgi:hypothetical protein